MLVGLLFILYASYFFVYSKISTITFIAFMIKHYVIIHIHAIWETFENFYEMYINGRQ